MTYVAENIVNFAALRHNFTQIKKLAPNCKIIAMIKSNGYGHGALEIAEVLQEADAFGVASVAEALALRSKEIKNKILILRGFADVEELSLISAHNFAVVLHDPSQLQILRNVKLKSPISAWFKIDTGMHRLGFAPEMVPAVYEELIASNNIAKPLVLMTHLASADVHGNGVTKDQLAVFNSITSGLDGCKSIANSAALLNWPETRVGWVRPGIMLYGVSPLRDKTGPDLGLKPVMTLRSRIIAIKNISKGEQVGYGGIWTAPETMKIGVVAIGYGDGYPWNAQGGTPVLVSGRKSTVIGRVSMDMIDIDLRDIPNAKCGDEVILWGENLAVEVISQFSNTIPYELLCGLSRRVEARYIS